MSDLNRNELEALRVLWDADELKPAEIEARFGWTIDNGTLRSILRGLVDKGHVSRKKSGKVFLYKARRSRAGVLSKMAKALADAFSGGSTAGLIAQLIEAERLSPSELEELKRVAKKNTGKRAGSPRSRG
jgi:predicted transcriptional regulator